MPGAVADGPTVTMSFANNFWGKEDAGVHPMLERMHNAKVTSDELKAFYSARAALEDEYARKLLSLSRKPLGSLEAGSLRASLDVTRGEVESMGKAHQAIAQQMKSELEEPLAAFAGGMKERRKIVQGGIEKLFKIKGQQTQSVNKSRDRYEQDCLRIKGFLAQSHMVMGQEERKNKAKLEKTQIQLASNSNEYETAIKCLQETTGKWNKDWKDACDKFQDLEEERLDYAKSSLWTFANIASTVCVSDDASCEKIRLSLENCEVEKDIMSFIQERGTGQEKYDAPKFINFCRGDVNDTSSEASEDESFSVAQYPRSINPAYRTSSPHPSTYESHHDPSSELAMNMGGRNDPHTPQSREQTVTPQKTPHQPPPGQPDFRRQAAQVQAAFQQQAPADLAPVPHNEYPTDGMTMFCRTDGHQSERSSNTSPIRTPSRDSQSDYSNPSYSSVEPPSGAASPTKHIAAVNSQPVSPNKAVQKKRSGFFGNSPFRRKSKHEKERPQSVLGSTLWGSSKNSSPTRPGVASRDFANQPDDLEPVDPRAHFQLNVGQNVFDVASPDSNRNSPTKLVKNKPPIDGSDSIEAALEELKGVTKQSSHRMSADNYHGLANTPAPGSQMQHPSAAAQRGTPPPSYHDQGMIKHLGAPQPAHTSKSMQAATRKYTNQNADMYGGENRPGSSMAPRSTSPLPIRSTSPRPGMGADNHRSASPNPYANQGRPGYGNQPQQQPNKYGSYSRHNSPGDVGRGAPSPAPYARENRPASSAGGMALQLSQGDGGALGQERRQQGGRPQSYYGGGNNNMVMSQDSGSRTRSKSVVGNSGGPRGGQFGRDGRAVLHFARASYSYTAAIPEELSFAKGDVLAVLRLQDDGWWEAEPTGQKRGRAGLVPSNYLQNC